MITLRKKKGGSAILTNAYTASNNVVAALNLYPKYSNSLNKLTSTLRTNLENDLMLFITNHRNYTERDYFEEIQRWNQMNGNNLYIPNILFNTNGSINTSSLPKLPPAPAPSHVIALSNILPPATAPIQAQAQAPATAPTQTVAQAQSPWFNPDIGFIMSNAPSPAPPQEQAPTPILSNIMSNAPSPVSSLTYYPAPAPWHNPDIGFIMSNIRAPAPATLIMNPPAPAPAPAPVSKKTNPPAPAPAIVLNVGYYNTGLYLKPKFNTRYFNKTNTYTLYGKIVEGSTDVNYGVVDSQNNWQPVTGQNDQFKFTNTASFTSANNGIQIMTSRSGTPLTTDVEWHRATNLRFLSTNIPEPSATVGGKKKSKTYRKIRKIRNIRNIRKIRKTKKY